MNKSTEPISGSSQVIAMKNNDETSFSPVNHDNREDEDDTNENAADIIREFGTHKLMNRVHKAYSKQLEETKYRLETILTEKQEHLNRLTSERETHGVQLYSLQQQLAQVQASLEVAHSEYNNLMDARLQDEEVLKELSKANHEKQVLYSEYKKQFGKYSNELTSLNETIRQIEQYNSEVKTEIALNRRALYKTEQSIQELEKNKLFQDVLADNLTKQIKDLEQQIVMYSSQLGKQKNETDEANSVLLETTKELELIANEKKQLTMQWKAALSGLSRRDEALAQATLTLQTAENAVYDYDVEIDGVKRQIQKEQENHENLINLRDRLDHDLQWVEENLIVMRNERDQLQERYTLLNKSLAQTDIDNKKLDLVTKGLNIEAETILQSIQVVTKERQGLEEEIQIAMSTKTNISKAVENLMKEQTKVLKKIHALENECNSIDNEVARTKVDSLNAMSLNDQVREQNENAVKVLHEKENMISKYQLEIRQRNDEVEKKMYRVDRLNKKYEKMVESVGGEENLGPLENVIKNLKRETDQITDDCKELERDWLKKQTDLVNLSGEGSRISDDNNELQARITIMTQQQLRINKDLRSLKSDVKVATQTYSELQKDILKLNGMINENQDQEGQLLQANTILEKDCIDELKDLEKECINMQASITGIKSSKGQLLDEIMDVERQASLWEKKIQLEKETKEALDPSVGQLETKSMEKEIRRMTLRLDALKREQERLIKEMENAIYKRSTISTRYTSNTSSGSDVLLSKTSTNSSVDLTQAGVKKRIGALKKDIRIMNEEIAEKVASIEQKKTGLHDVSSEFEKITSQYGDAEETSQILQNQINDLLYQKQLQQERIFYKQKYVKRLREISQLGIDYSQTLPIERRLLASTQALENVRDVINDLTQSYPHLNEVLSRVQKMADVDISIYNVHV